MKWKLAALTLLLTAGCGVAQDQHDQVVADLSEAKTQVADLRAEISSVETRANFADSEVTTLRADISRLNTEKSELAGHVKDLEAQVTDLQGQPAVLTGDGSCQSQAAQYNQILPSTATFDYSSNDTLNVSLKDWSFEWMETEVGLASWVEMYTDLPAATHHMAFPDGFSIIFVTTLPSTVYATPGSVYWTGSGCLLDYRE